MPTIKRTPGEIKDAYLRNLLMLQDIGRIKKGTVKPGSKSAQFWDGYITYHQNLIEYCKVSPELNPGISKQYLQELYDDIGGLIETARNGRKYYWKGVAKATLEQIELLESETA